MNLRCTICLFIFSFSISFGQPGIDKGDSNFEKLAYVDAIDIYESIASKGFKSKDLLQKLGDAYYFNGLFEKAKSWYDQLFQHYDNIDSEYYFRYAQCLKSIKNYEEADKLMEQFYEKTNDYRGKMYVQNRLYLQEITHDLDRYIIKDAGINSSVSDYGSYFIGNKMYFITSRKFAKSPNNIDKWSNQNFTNIMSVRLDSVGNAIYINEITDEINSKLHESTMTISKDGKTMYFTRNNIYKGKIGFNDKKIVLLKIYKAEFIEGKWKVIMELPFNNDDYNVAHPALNEDESYLYFVSDKPGGFGGSDLYKVKINNDGTFGEPVNLGSKINTKARETFPYIDKNGNLFFASDGHLGLGGLDIYKTKTEDYSTIENLGAPINSEKDDFAFTDSPFEKTYFFSSNRDGGKGFDDVYKAIEKNDPDKVLFNLIVNNQTTNQPIHKAKVFIYDANYNLIKEAYTDSIGELSYSGFRKDREYIVKTESNGYFTSEKRYKGSKLNEKEVIFLQPKFIDVKEGDDLIKKLGINIYFDLDNYFIRPDAQVELAKIIEVMLKYPKIKIHIKSHTDSRQSQAYNLRLSEFRAKSTMDYMIKHGIDKKRLTAKGYGESELLNECSDGVPCTREQHQLNRRSEFIVVK